MYGRFIFALIYDQRKARFIFQKDSSHIASRLLEEIFYSLILDSRLKLRAT